MLLRLFHWKDKAPFRAHGRYGRLRQEDQTVEPAGKLDLTKLSYLDGQELRSGGTSQCHSVECNPIGKKGVKHYRNKVPFSVDMQLVSSGDGYGSSN